ncbi:hypothetical protein K438DRAFT_1705927 [Mycena galopus ATCC 62051]|nr:hypothetical protein K438DRAFT_1705927 [Mycena galopus ATCC 62051]
MTAKTLSTSTLSLKFMQNAHRAKNLAEVQLERAEVKDDGEWEVAKEIRAAWVPEAAQSVSYEASYLPFLFTSDASGSGSDAANLKGQRAFKRGREVADEVRRICHALLPPFSFMFWVFFFPRILRQYQVINVPAAPEAKPSPTSAAKSAGKQKQPSTISGRTGSNTNPKKAGNANAPPKGKSARQAIYDNSDVGTDLRKTQVKMDPDAN